MIPLERTAQVWCITGNLGGGKTLSAVSMAVDAIRKGYFVVSNVTLKNLESISPYASDLYQHIVVRDEDVDEYGNLVTKSEFNPFKLPCGSPRGTKNGKRVLIILDEVAEWFDQYANPKSPFISRVLSWLRHTSKRSQDVILICQRREYLNKSFRVLVSRFLIVDDLAVWRVPVFKCTIPFMDDFCLVRTYDRAGHAIGKLRIISKPKFGRFYNTAENLSAWGKDTEEYALPPEPRRGIIFYVFLVIASNLFLWIS